MKTTFNWFGDDWRRVKNHCRTTDNKDFTENDATDTFKQKLLISEHSPIRLLEFDWSWKKIKYWLSTEWSRHKFEKFISSERDDRGFANNYTVNGFSVWDDITQKEITYKPNTREDAPQKSKVNFDGYANMQNLIDSFRKRLCFQCTEDARLLAEDFKLVLSKTHPMEANVLVPNCIYRAGCPEFSCCGLWPKFLKWCDDNSVDISTIQKRYNAYNIYFIVSRGGEYGYDDVKE